MKKSSSVLLSAAFLAFVASCRSHKVWISGVDSYDPGATADLTHSDTVVHHHNYRYYRGNYYRVSHSQIHVPLRIADPEAYASGKTDSLGHKHILSSIFRRRTGGFGSIAITGAAHS